MRNYRYAVQSLNSQTNEWRDIYTANSLKKAKLDAKNWEFDVKRRMEAGRVHYSIGVRIVKPGDLGDPLYLKTWGPS